MSRLLVVQGQNYKESRLAVYCLLMQLIVASPPVGLVELILPKQFSILDHAVVPQDLAVGHSCVHLVC